MCFNFEYPTLKWLTDPLTVYNHNGRWKGGHYPGQPFITLGNCLGQQHSIVLFRWLVSGFEMRAS